MYFVTTNFVLTNFALKAECKRKAELEQIIEKQTGRMKSSAAWVVQKGMYLWQKKYASNRRNASRPMDTVGCG